MHPIIEGPATPMGELETHLRGRRDAGHKLLVPYVTGGLRDDWLDVLAAMVDAGADAVEIGIPFSDPVMDGPTIQEASYRALARGTTPTSVLDDLHRGEIGVPLVAMTYYNLVYRFGHRRFAAEAVAAGISGVILPDVPMEEQAPWQPAADEAGLDTVMLASPISPDDRLQRLCDMSKGFVYGVNLLGVTGERDSLGDRAARLAGRLKATTDLPVLMGFGVSRPDQAQAVASVSDGAVVASALMRRALDGASPTEIGKFVAEFRAAID
jgi:tryptophan synthase alpha chain